MNDLKTFAGWMAEAHRLLADKPDWTAIRGDGGYMVVVEGNVYAVPEVVDTTYVYTEDDLGDPDICAWNDELGCWDGVEPEKATDMLTKPVFVTLAHEEA